MWSGEDKNEVRAIFFIAIIIPILGIVGLIILAIYHWKIALAIVIALLIISCLLNYSDNKKRKI
jgi:hypothetical protein